MNGRVFPLVDRLARFPAHGSFTTTIRGPLLLVDLLGPWNVELVAAYQKQLDADAAMLAAAGPWAVVVQVYGSALFTPEAMRSMQAKAAWQQRQLQRRATAYVVAPETEGAQLVEAPLRSIYAPSQPFALFREVPPALAWAHAQLAAQPPYRPADGNKPDMT